VNDKFEREAVDPGKTLEFPALKDRKGLIESPRKVLFDRRDVTLHDVIVVEHPLGTSGESFSVVSGLGKALIDPLEHFSVVLVRLQESSGTPTAKGSTVRFGELEREFSESLSAEHLSSPWGFGLLTGGGESSSRGES
jgi:hypothetical protein